MVSKIEVWPSPIVNGEDKTDKVVKDGSKIDNDNIETASTNTIINIVFRFFLPNIIWNHLLIKIIKFKKLAIWTILNGL
jgi:hypothetical protein